MENRVRIACQRPKDDGWPPHFEGEMTSDEADSIAKHYEIVFRRLLGVVVIPADFTLE